MELTEKQIEFIYIKFFSNNHKYSKEIAYTLITRGSAIVGTNEPIWSGGIGNFIKSNYITGGYGCMEYKFDLNSFLDSHFFKELYNAHIENLEFRLSNLEKEINELKLFEK
jgi:hypothetical protein